MALPSIPLRVHIWYGAILLVALTGLGLATYRYESAVLTGNVDDELHRRLQIVAEAMQRASRPPLNPQPSTLNQGELVLSAEEAKLFEGSSDHGYYYLVWSASPAEWKRSTNSPPEVPRPAPEGLLAGIRQREIYREAVQFTSAGDCLLAGRSMASVSAQLRRNTSAPFWRGLALLGLALGGGWLLSPRKTE